MHFKDRFSANLYSLYVKDRFTLIFKSSIVVSSCIQQFVIDLIIIILHKLLIGLSNLYLKPLVIYLRYGQACLLVNTYSDLFMLEECWHCKYFIKYILQILNFHCTLSIYATMCNSNLCWCFYLVLPLEQYSSSWPLLNWLASLRIYN